MKFTDKLQLAVKNSRSVLCVGLDPNLHLLPDAVKKEFRNPEEQVLHFCKKVIEVTQDYCAAYKPNAAFFEALGTAGTEILKEVLDAIPRNKIVITDAKRGDISSTAEHYKKAFFDFFDADAVTINPLMGFETLEAFSHDESKALYVLALTSNPGADDFLKQPFRGYRMMAEYIAETLRELADHTDTHLGMVVGATQPHDLLPVLERHPAAALLIPGIGAQGGSAAELEPVLKKHRGIPLINSSRGIIYAGSNKEDWPNHVAAKAAATKTELQHITNHYV